MTPAAETCLTHPAVYFPLIIEPLIQMALLEDLGQGDMTTDHLPGMDKSCEGFIRTRETLIVSGLDVAVHVFKTIDPGLRIDRLLMDGDYCPAGTTLVSLSGQVGSILRGERVALNFLQHLSGIATITRQFVEAIQETGKQCRITDTRKTTPGLRLLEKQAVLHGGGSSHRFNLGSAVMLKDNHIEAVGSIATALAHLRRQIPHTARIEVETDTLDQVEEALAAGADIILLDNMTPDDIRKALDLIGDKATVEASGGITLDNVKAYAETGVAYLSTSQLTLGAPAVDIGLDIVT